MTGDKVLVPPLDLDRPPRARPSTDALSRRINADPEDVEQGLAQLVLTIVELLRQLMERQALRRVQVGDLTDEETERLGRTMMLLSERMDELKEQFGLQDSDLNLNLGPLGNLMSRSDMPIPNAPDRYMRLLLQQIAIDRYPSGELMDRVEIMLDQEHVDDYVELLFEKIERDHYPSKQMLDRVARWTLSAG